MARQKKAYFGLDWIISLILAIFPLTNWILGIVTRVQRENWLGVILNIIPITAFFIYFIDLFTMIVNKDLTVLA